jgi:hypothetical protein
MVVTLNAKLIPLFGVHVIMTNYNKPELVGKEVPFSSVG